MKVLSIRFEIICLLAVSLSSQEEVNITELEEGYIKHFGNETVPQKSWEIAKLWYHEKDATKLRKFCASAHALAGKGTIVVDAVLLRQRVLKFFNRAYHVANVLVAAYGIIGNKTAGILERDFWYTNEPTHWYLTEGQRPDCAYLLTLADTRTVRFTLEQHVCGIELPQEF